MTSLRSRLIVSYAALVALVLIALACVLSRFAFAFLAQPTLDAVSQSVAAAERVVAANPHANAGALRVLINDAAKRPGVVVMTMRDGPGGPGGKPPSGPTENAIRFSFSSVLGLRPRPVHVPHGNDVLIAADLRTLQPVLTAYFESLAISIIVAIGLAFVFARWITDQALAPLVAVTGELRRFAGGDFTPRPVATNDRTEFGELIAAYNGATAQVASAFAERVRVEQEMQRFVADAGHELRTPLTVVSAFVDVLEKGGVDDADIRERAFRTLRAETRRMRRLVERMMALARLERPEPTRLSEIDVAEIARGAVAEVVAARRAEVAVEVSSPDTCALADSGDLHEAVGNLVENALKYGAGSRVQVLVGTGGDRVLVRVRDHGNGISDRDRPHLFERFFRGEHAAGIEGSGLGLAIVERAMARCGGTVRLESTSAHGTTFVLAVPAKLASAREPAPLHIG